jgi:hypothetical protein
MKQALLLACVLALPFASGLASEKPDDFAWSLPLETDPREGLQQLELDALVHQGLMRRDLGDVRIFNAAGESVPYAFAPIPQPPAATPDPIALPIFPIHGERGARIEALDLKVQARADGTVVGLSTQPKGPERAGSRIGYLLDASAIKAPVAALRLDWTPPATGTHVRVRIEESSDLDRWTTLVQAAPLIDLQFRDQRLQRNRIAFAARTPKYLRVTFGEGEEPIALDRAWAEPAAAAAEPKRLWREVTGAQVAGTENRFEYDLGGLFPVDRLRVDLPNANTVARVRIATRARTSEPWRPVTEAVVYRLLRGGSEVASPDIAFGAVADRYWLLEADTRGGGLGSGVPSLHAGWIPRRIAFAARGAPPFRLAFGNGEAKPSAYPIATLVPSYEPGKVLDLPQARLGAPAPNAPSPAPPADKPDYRRWSLWAVLLLAVAVLAAMAYRLVRHMRTGADTGGSPQGGEAQDARRD